MKKNNFLRSTLAIFLLSSPLADAEPKYPAADFKPTVQYQDSEYIAKSKSPSASSKQSQPTAPDSQYPAAAFEPKVLFSDSDYKHSTPKVTAPKSSSTSVDLSASAGEAAVATTGKKPESNSSLLIALVVLALVGFAFFRKKSGTKSPAAKQYPAFTPDTSGLTGVSKYLQNKEGPIPTGVAKYLDKQVATVKEKAAATGVAKYLEKKVVESETGVSKYLRSKS
ncbi:MAG: hypothetical protein CVV06_14405 [Gammaproteobacteria bacterium HGW-Gammaproteobacteria-10]|nr:MAG: hypothetical protein CVV13_06410 [Gammaproteobacteria bacterium HGW-Gammaproteobacteria-3]PKM35796.1 MAG: hypothetical protein CVV06_14405 [Gammaproteobacteria bacterium HGW-Gammaproteobacteria-10]